MTDFRDSIFILDLHNTLYDEVLEYGGAIAAAIRHFHASAKACDMELDEDALCAQLTRAHAAAGSDWDDDVWRTLPELRRLGFAEDIIRQAISLRQNASEALTKRHAYTETLASLRALKGAGARIILATEATANAAADAVLYLDFDGVPDSVYSWPYAKPYRPLEKTRQMIFPALDGAKNLYLQKPNARILAAILLDIAKEEGVIPAQTGLSDIYDTVTDESADIAPLLAKIRDPENNPQAVHTVRAIQLKLAIKEGPHKAAMERLHARTFYVGDSFFKDGFLARNAGIPFIHAAYGKIVPDQNTFAEARDLLYKVTGWEPFLLELTQEAAKMPELTGLITPHYTCGNSLQDFLDFREKRS